MILRNSCICLVTLLLLVSTANAESVANKESLSGSTSTKTENLISEGRKEWGLSSDDWQRYEAIMNGPRGKWSKDLDPLTALGIEARTEAERRRYAELLVLATRQRVERELAFQIAYDEANARLFPTQLPVIPFLMREVSSPTSSLQSKFENVASDVKKRIAFFTLIKGCSECDLELKRLLKLGQVMDVYLVDSGSDDKKIRQWARAKNIPLERVNDRTITLNHNKYASVTTQTKLPAVVRLGQ
jgi:integrating conjugative element protein (TIGR03759 family)